MTTLLTFVPMALALVIVLAWRRKPRPPYPPGPWPKPIVGNAFDIPSEMSWVKYLEWSKHFGSDTIHLSAMNTHMIILHKLEDIIELLEKRSANYSTRPWIPIAELLGLDNVTALIPYGKEWRKHRIIFQEGLNREVLPLYRNGHTEKVNLFLDLLRRDPDQFKEHCKWLASAVTMSTAFGYDIPEGDITDRYVTLAERILLVASKLCQPGGTVINAIPFLRHVPCWFPGASTQRLAAEVKKISLAHKNEPFEHVKRNLLAGTSKECVLTELLHHRLNDDGTLEDEDELKDTMANIYLAGADTLQASQLVFLMAMALHPRAQQRAQEEIDRIVGTTRLPSFEDRPSLPYVDAVLRETLRWRPVVPLAIPHATIKDDIYKGFYIPQGTVVLANGWAVSQDEDTYSDPDMFNPDRFFNPDGTLNDDTVDFAFGYGRRICPGNLLANDVLWLMIAAVLSTFEICKAKDQNGMEIEIDCNAFSSGMNSFPRPFTCSIVPRSQEAEALIHSAADTARENSI